ncbi:MAG: hypothetical protein LBH67_02230 [Rickettsia sp.]|jgi:hypothetical protein|nr:hypothetical protein [Rickettsia sp.]
MSKDQDQQQDQKNIYTVLSGETVTLTKMQNAIGELLEANQQLKDSMELKQQVDALKKEAPSLPWFRRFVQIIPQVKYLFIKNDEQIAAERRENNRKLLSYVDNTLQKIGERSSSLQVIIDKELQTGLEKVLHKSLSQQQKQKAEELQARLDSLGVSQENFRKIVPKVYSVNEAVALMHERTQLTQIQQDITKLVDANSKVQGLLAIKKELTELQQRLPSTWLDSLKKIVVKIKDAFIKNSEQILKDTVTKNNATLQHVDSALKITSRNIEDSALARRDKLHKELENLQKRKLLPEQLERVKLLSSTIDLTFAKAVVASEPLFAKNQEQAQSQALYSSMPNLHTTPLRPAPPPPLANTSLPNLTVQQPNIAETIPPAPPLAGHGTQQIMAGSMPPQPKRQAPPPPTQATSLQNLAAQQPDVAPAVVPPPPPPPHVVPGLQQGAHQVDTQVVPPPLAAELNIPPPPPLPVGGFYTPPPPPPPPTGQPKNPVAASPIEGQENRVQLLDEITAGITLKKVEAVEKPPTRDDMLAQINKIGIEGHKLKPAQDRKIKESPLDMEASLKKEMEKRREAFQDDDEDEHEHADLVKFIKNKEVNESSLISKLHVEFPDSKDIKSKKELVEFIKQDLSEDWNDDDWDKQEAIVKKLETIKAKYEEGTLDLSPKSVVEAPTGVIPTNLVAAAQAIGQNMQKPENVAGQTIKPPPAPPLPPKIRPAGGQGV